MIKTEAGEPIELVLDKDFPTHPKLMQWLVSLNAGGLLQEVSQADDPDVFTEFSTYRRDPDYA